MDSYPLWSPENKSVYSSCFNVPPRKCAVLFAAGLSEEKARVSAEEFKGPQLMCVRRLTFDFSGSRLVPVCDRCGRDLFDIDGVAADMIEDEYVESCGVTWQLEPCRNLAVIGVPGVYRLRLNDATAVGSVQVYLSWHDAHALPPQTAHLFFA